MLKIGFLGEYEHSLDEKGRFSVPAKFRDYLKKISAEGATLVVTKGKDKCVEAYAQEDWAKLFDKFTQDLKLDDREENRAYVDSRFRNADYVNVDSAGRILLPQNLKSYAQIKDRVIIMGAGEKFKIWDPTQLKEFDKKHGGV